MEKDRLKMVFDTLVSGDEPSCVVCDYRCPFSTYSDGKYCESYSPKCYESFKMWLNNEID